MPTRKRAQATLVYDTGEREDDALARLQWVVPIVFLGALFILFFSVIEWVGPATPFLAFVGLVWVPVGVVIWWKKRATATTRAVARTLGVLALIGLPLLAWAMGPYRAATLWVVGEFTPVEVALEASGDRSDLVAAHSCKRLLSSDEPRRLQRMEEVLETRPEVAVDCLSAIEQERRGAAVRISSHLHRIWYRGWMSDEDFDEELVCREADQFLELARMHGTAGTPDLLMCALEAGDERAATCCAKALSNHATEDQILTVEPETWVRDLEEPLFIRLSEAVDLPAQRLMGAEPVSSSLQWTPADLFHWTTHLGCHLMGTHPDADGVAQQLSQTIETQCGIEVGDPAFSFTAVRFVERTCTQAGVGERRRRVDVENWCNAARDANRGAAVEAAEFVVYRARRAHIFDDVFHGIHRGTLLVEDGDRSRPLFSVERLSDIRADRRLGTDSVRLGRPDWAEHTPKERQDLDQMRQDFFEEREKNRSQINDDADLSEAEIDRRADQAAGHQARQRIERMRNRGDDDE